jgi:hypothetical protein
MIRDKMTPSLAKIQQQLNKLPQQAYEVFVANTPVNSGNARRRTQLKGSTIEANYAYATRLDQGYSQQKPKGMTEPTDKFIRTQLTKIIRK